MISQRNLPKSINAVMYERKFIMGISYLLMKLKTSYQCLIYTCCGSRKVGISGQSLEQQGPDHWSAKQEGRLTSASKPAPGQLRICWPFPCLHRVHSHCGESSSLLSLLTLLFPILNHPYFELK